MMSTGGNLVFSSRVPWLLWLAPLVAAGAVFWAAAERDQDWMAAVWIAPLAAVAALTVMWGGSTIAGLRTLAGLRQLDDQLVCQRLHLFNRGKSFSVPISEVSNWRIRSTALRGRDHETVSFQAEGKTYKIPLYDAEHL